MKIKYISFCGMEALYTHRFYKSLVLCIGMMMPCLLYGQQPDRDPQALAVLQSAIEAGGGKAFINNVRDFRATGTITYSWAGKNVKGIVEIQGRGLNQFRMDSHMEDGLHSIILNHGAGKAVDPNGMRVIPPETVAAIGLVILPLPTVTADLGLPGRISEKGMEQRAGVSLHNIEVHRTSHQQLDQTLDSHSPLSNLGRSEVLIDPATFMVVATRVVLTARTSRARNIVREMNYSDFRKVGGLVVPFTIQERAGDQLISTIVLSSIDFNVGVADDVFHQ
jgi:hypothetical protein